ncbi:unnamed protein product [Penicillium salamii]|nr:unnamed protein product [Penicillium salamii]CAG8262525.1 unnamed protein product [Penicillium salamii]
MNPVQPKNKENEYHSIFLPSAAPTELPLTSCVLRTPRELPEDINGIGSSVVSLEASDFSKHNNLETIIPGCQSKGTVCSKKEHQSALHRTGEKSTENICKRNSARKRLLAPHSLKYSRSIISAPFKNRALSKAIKLGPITYRSALKITEQLCKTQLTLLKNHLKDRDDFLSDGETLLRELATAHPKYNRIIQTLPILLRLVPGELKERLMIEENVELLKMGAYLANKWISRPT